MINILGLKEIFPTTTLLKCAWHLEQNLKKKVSHLNKGKKDLYETIVSLPYLRYEQDYHMSYDEIIQNEALDKKFIDYFKDINQSKELWVKCFIKKHFTCGMVTSSRVESKHRVLKEYLNGASRLGDVYACFKLLENQEKEVLKNEIQKFSRKENENLDQYDLIKQAKNIYSEYVISLLKANIFQSIHYEVNPEENDW